MVGRRYVEWRYQKAKRRVIRAFCSKLYQDTDRRTRRSMIVAGTGRSGTTWVSDLIASRISCRMMFEPFHSEQVQAYQQFSYFQYMRPTERNQQLRAYCHRVFTGEIRHRWVDRQVEQIFPQYRLVKDIRANLLLGWIHTNFPEVPLLFVMRHPCAVVLSRMQLGWWTDGDIEPFLYQPKLLHDFLADKLEVIQRAKTVEEKHAIVWCVHNLVPIRQFASDPLNVVFYENLCTHPEQEVPKMFRAIGRELSDATIPSVSRPSTTAVRTSSVVTGADKVTRWKDELSSEQVSHILSVVEEFELSHIYGECSTPQVEAL